MLAGAVNAKLYAEWFAHIKAHETKDAFAYLVGLSATLSRYTCYPRRKGIIRDFCLLDGQEEMPFGLIPNKSWLLFYFRLPAVRSGIYSFSMLAAGFESARINNRGEWTIKVCNISDVQRLWRILALS